MEKKMIIKKYAAVFIPIIVVLLACLLFFRSMQNNLVFKSVLFACLVVILGKFAWRPLLDSIDERARGIKNDLDFAKRTKEEVEALKNDYSEKLEKNEQHLKEIMEKAKQEAENIRSEIIGKLRQEAKDIYEKANAALGREKDKLVLELRQEAVAISIDATEKLLKQVLDKNMQKKFVHDFLDDLDKDSNELH